MINRQVLQPPDRHHSSVRTDSVWLVYDTEDTAVVCQSGSSRTVADGLDRGSG
jgi:hypothetical protein